MSSIVEIKNLEIDFRVPLGIVHSIRGISFNIDRGETLALVGESGSGKSVTAKALMGLLPQNGSIVGGQILIDGKDYAHAKEKEFESIRGGKIAMIFQDPMTSLNPIITIGKQIVEAIELHQNISSKKERDLEAINILNKVGIKNSEEIFKEYPHQLSGGMRQRIVIAIALACQPEILICDEPTTALDVTIQAQILDLLKELQKEFNFAMLFITHDLGVVANIADNIIVMYAGNILESGQTKEVLYNARHPYTWGLLLSRYDEGDDVNEKLYNIKGTPPSLLTPPKGCPFAARNDYAMEIDFIERPPLFEITKTHKAATWLLSEHAPKVEVPEKIKLLNKKYGGTNE